jgi:calcineurin-like phosphoesterase
MASTSHERRINALLILSGAVLALLLVAFLGRMVVPRIQSERTSQKDGLISDIIQVQVLNGAGRAGLANRFTAALRKSGFDVVESGNFESFDVPHTYVIDRIGNLDHARRVARALNVSEDRIIREVSSGFFLDATVVIGLDYDSLNIP